MVEINIASASGEATSEEVFEEIAWPEEASEFETQVNETPLFQLKNRRETIAGELVKSFQVPRWESPEVFCEFSIVEPSALAKALTKREKQKARQDDWVSRAYCDVLAPACTAVYAVLDGDEDTRYSLRSNDPNGKLTKIDHDLAEALGLDSTQTTASSTFRKLFFSEGDLLEFATRIFRWSAIVNEEVDENF